MIKAIKDFPIYDDSKKLVYYKSGETVYIKDQKLIDKLILSGKCTLHDPRKKSTSIESKIIEDYEKQVDVPAKKKRRKK